MDARQGSWRSLRINFDYVVDNLQLDGELLDHLLAVKLINYDDYEELRDKKTPRRKSIVHLLRDILLKQDDKRFPEFCMILEQVKQAFIAQRLTECAEKIDESAAHVVESAGCSSKVAVTGRRADIVASSRPTGTDCHVGKELGTSARDLDVLESAEISTEVVASGCKSLAMSEATATTSVRSPHALRVTARDVDLEEQDESKEGDLARLWLSLSNNYDFLCEKLRCNVEFLSRLFQELLISRVDFETLDDDNKLTLQQKIQYLIDILPNNPPHMFLTLCEILRDVGQSHVADKLEENPQKAQLVPQGMKSLETVSLQRMEEMIRRERQRADIAEAEKMGLQWDVLLFRYRSHHHSGDSRQINDSVPSWTQWNVRMPYDDWCSYGRMVEMEGRLVVAGGGTLHVLTDKGDEWDTFVRKKGNIRNVVCHQGVCLVCVKDYDRRFVVEQFYLNEANEWRSLTVLPNELQLDCVSVALHENSLYVVGGRTKLEKVSTARVHDLNSGHWYNMDDMQTKRSCCSSVVINNTVFVAGGMTDGYCCSNTVECVDVRGKGWRTIPSTTNCLPSLIAVGNRLVATGGITQQRGGYSSNVVELYDERSTKWRHLPQMAYKQWFHAALSTHNGELIAAGGTNELYKRSTSIESLKLQ